MYVFLPYACSFFSAFDVVTEKMSKRFEIPIVFLLLFCLSLVTDCKTDDAEKENTDNNPYEFHIGGVLSNNGSEGYFKQTIEVTYTSYTIFISNFNVLNNFRGGLPMQYVYHFYACSYYYCLYNYNLASKLQHAVHETR